MVSNEAGDEARMMRDAAVLGKLEPVVFWIRLYRTVA
jgi:hypothetical protein